jgi:inhibitor of cysteine peptidase
MITTPTKPISPVLCLVVLALLCAPGCKSKDPAAMKPAQVLDFDTTNTVDKKTISMYVGELFTVRLRSQSGTGYGWNIAGGVNDKGVVTLVRRRTEKDAKAAPGAAEWEVFDLKARRSGQTTVDFVFERPWERNVPAVKRVNLTVDVGY